MFFEIGLIDGTHLVGSHTHAPLELRVRDGHERGERLVRFVSTSPGSRHDLHHVQNELIYQWKGFSFPETKKKKKVKVRGGGGPNAPGPRFILSHSRRLSASSTTSASFSAVVRGLYGT